jgi:hypothetical protein
MLRGRAFEQFPEAFVAGLKAGFFEGLLKVVRHGTWSSLTIDCQSANNSVSAMLCLDAGVGGASGLFIRPICRKYSAHPGKDVVRLT